MTVHPHTRHLLLGGQRSGKSRCAEALALGWVASTAGRRASVVATAEVRDDDAEMRARIARHRADRPAALATVEAPRALAACIAAHSAPDHLLIVDCLTLWQAQCYFNDDAGEWPRERDVLVAAVAHSAGPLLLVSNEIGLGVLPLGREARACVDELGWLHQALAACCSDVTLMVAGLPLAVKREAV